MTRNNDFSIALKTAMKEKGISVRSLAATTGISIMYLYRILRGNTNLTLQTIERIEAAVDSKLLS